MNDDYCVGSSRYFDLMKKMETSYTNTNPVLSHSKKISEGTILYKKGSKRFEQYITKLKDEISLKFFGSSSYQVGNQDLMLEKLREYKQNLLDELTIRNIKFQNIIPNNKSYSNYQRIYLTPMVDTKRKKMTDKEKKEFKEAERIASSMRRWEYTHGLTEEQKKELEVTNLVNEISELEQTLITATNKNNNKENKTNTNVTNNKISFPNRNKRNDNKIDSKILRKFNLIKNREKPDDDLINYVPGNLRNTKKQKTTSEFDRKAMEAKLNNFSGYIKKYVAKGLFSEFIDNMRNKIKYKERPKTVRKIVYGIDDFFKKIFWKRLKEYSSNREIPNEEVEITEPPIPSPYSPKDDRNKIYATSQMQFLQKDDIPHNLPRSGTNLRSGKISNGTKSNISSRTNFFDSEGMQKERKVVVLRDDAYDMHLK